MEPRDLSKRSPGHKERHLLVTVSDPAFLSLSTWWNTKIQFSTSGHVILRITVELCIYLCTFIIFFGNIYYFHLYLIFVFVICITSCAFHQGGWDGICSTHGEYEEFVKNCSRKIWRDILGTLGVGGSKILTWIQNRGRENVDWIKVVQDRVQWRSPTNTVMSLRAGKFLDKLSDYQLLEKKTAPRS
jgi:hypothetical protein